MKVKKYILPLCIFLSILFPASGQQRICIAFYNVENLHDTIPSRFYDDREFTAGGKYKWGTDRYSRKLENISRVIGDMGADIIALAEVENETVVRDLVLQLPDDYNYIHCTSGDRRGMDLALLYKGDKFWPEKVSLLPSPATREFLLIRGEILNEGVNILICHLPSKANGKAYRRAAIHALAAAADSLLKNDPSRKLILMGDFNTESSERIFRDAFGRKAGAGFFDRSMLLEAVQASGNSTFGSYAYGNRRMLIDHIMLSVGFVYGEGLRFQSGGIFVREYMLTSPSMGAAHSTRSGFPFRTITAGAYTGGFSDHLPVFVVLAKP